MVGPGAACRSLNPVPVPRTGDPGEGLVLSVHSENLIAGDAHEKFTDHKIPISGALPSLEVGLHPKI